MKKVVLLLSLFLFTLPKLSAQFEGTPGIGVHAGYGSDINSLGVGGHIHYYRTNNLRFSPSFTYFLERKGNEMLMVDADAHYILPVSITASLYPIAGLNYSKHRFNLPLEDDVAGSVEIEQQTKRRLGANLGLGFQYDIGYRMRANFELKYQFIRDYSQVVLMAGIGFWL